MKPLADMGLSAVMALELEFFLLDPKRDSQGRPSAAKRPSTGEAATTTNCYGLDELDAFDAFLSDVDKACRIQGVPAETATSEYAPAQFEINLKHVPDPLQACDHAVMLKRAIKAVAEKHGFLASFMAKPFAEMAGSGMHLHVSIVDENGDNALAEPSDDESGLAIGPKLLHAIGGLLEAMPESMAIFAPNANSYRRLIPGSYAPVRAQWGINNRSVPLRIPISDDAALRIEHRCRGCGRQSLPCRRHRAGGHSSWLDDQARRVGAGRGVGLPDERRRVAVALGRRARRLRERKRSSQITLAIGIARCSRPIDVSRTIKRIS